MDLGVPPAILLEATLRSIGVGLATAAVSGVVGLLMAWLVERTRFPGSRILSGLLAVPYALPPYLLGMAWVVLGNPSVGLLKDFLPAGGSYGFWGMALVLASVTFAFPYLELRAGFSKLDPSLEEAARISGASPARVFRDVSFPLLWPAWVNGMCLAFLYALSAFGVPALLGLPVRKFVLTTLIYSQLKVGGVDGLRTGLALSAILLAIAAVALLISYLLVRIQRKRIQAITGARTSRPSSVDLGKARYLASGASWALFGVSVALPWIALGLSALAPVAGKYSPSLWTLKNLVYVVTLPDFQEGLFNSLLLAAGVATFVAAGGFLLAYAAVRRKSRRARAVIESLGIPFATPGTVLAILLIYGSALLSGFGIPLDTPLFLMGLAYALKYAAVGARSLATAFEQVHPSMEEAARVSGARTGELLRGIWFPLLKKVLLAAWFLAALPMLTELTMSVLLTGPGGSTLGTVLFQLQEYADQPSAAALAWVLLTVALLIGLYEAFFGQKGAQA